MPVAPRRYLDNLSQVRRSFGAVLTNRATFVPITDASAAVIGEAREGDAELAALRLSLLEDVKLLEVTQSAIELASDLLRRTQLPAKAEIDALHMAVATVHGMDYLLTWNCKRIANAVTLPSVYEICRLAGYEPPFVCTPQELMEGEVDG